MEMETLIAEGRIRSSGGVDDNGIPEGSVDADDAGAGSRGVDNYQQEFDPAY